jgi:hypothetical protein
MRPDGKPAGVCSSARTLPPDKLLPVRALRRWLLIAVVSTLGTAWVQTARGGLLPFVPPATPRPAVARIIAPDGQGFSFGSGTLVATSQQHGLVVTNWHVIRDATGQIVVAFPDGFRSGATVLAVDRDWDLAALAIWKPDVAPVSIAAQAPRPGEPLTIAGYGPGQYREATGRCIQYVAPGTNFPPEMLELSAGARQGDSGGPIFNQRGELAGVLFGAAWGSTTGSYSGRVRQFLAPIAYDFQRLQPSASMIAGRQTESRTMGAPTAQGGRSAITSVQPVHAPEDSSPPPVISEPITVSIAAQPVTAKPLQVAGTPADWRATSAPAPTTVTTAPSAPASAHTLPAAVGATPLDQLKTFLAAIGALAILFHALRLLGGTEPPSKNA